MAPESYADIFRLTVFALGAATVLGTGAALLRYRRTGAFPGQAADDSPERRRSGVRGAIVKLTVGAVLTIWGVSALIVS